MLQMVLLLLITWWAGCLLLLWLWKRPLISRTWNEPYIAGLPVLIESDDWGPGGAFHGERFQALSDLLARHQDTCGRPAVLTADMVLSVPDTRAIRDGGYIQPKRSFLDVDYRPLLETFHEAMSRGTMVPQLHGIEHLNGEALMRLAREGDPRVAACFSEDNWWDWESLDSPLQGHYVDGSHLPTEALAKETIQSIVADATAAFERIFGIPSISTVAPCYLWNDTVEDAWSSHGIRYIQTAGYRCTGRAGDGRYQQDLPEIRVGDRSSAGQLYLVRNAMYEPVDGRRADTCYLEALRAHRQGLPVVISTHRYNYTRSEQEFENSLKGLGEVLTRLDNLKAGTRYLSSPELGAWLAGDREQLESPGNRSQWPTLHRLTGLSRLRGFLYRLWYRHEKLRYATVVTGLVLPATLIVVLESLLPEFSDAH